MWNILIVIIIAVAIWMFAPSINLKVYQNQSNLKQAAKSTKSAVKDYTDPTVEQVNEARQLQQQEQERLNDQ